jgi:hypothetical protein
MQIGQGIKDVRPVIVESGLDDNMIDLADQGFAGFSDLLGLKLEHRRLYDEPVLFGK